MAVPDEAMVMLITKFLRALAQTRGQDKDNDTGVPGYPYHDPSAILTIPTIARLMGSERTYLKANANATGGKKLSQTPVLDDRGNPDKIVVLTCIREIARWTETPNSSFSTRR